MIQSDTFKWFVRGFALTALALLVVVMVVNPNIGWAQGGDDEPGSQEAVAEEGEPSTTLATDDPAGRNMVPVSPDDPEDDERERAERGDVSATESGTDDPHVGQGSAGDSGGVGTAGEISAQEYGSPLVIPAAAFAPRRTGEIYNFLYDGGYTQGGWGCVMAPAYLPDGATVEDVYATVYDNDSVGYVRIYVYRVDNFDGTTDSMAGITTNPAGASPDIQRLGDSTIQEPDVVYPDYSYYVLTCLDSVETRLYSVRFYYSE